jgi:hypothetical protein
MSRIWDNEPASIAGAFIAIVAVVKAFLRWGGIEVPTEADTAVQLAIAAWVGLLVRSKVTPNGLAEHRVSMGNRPTEPLTK